jgi:hypothetical protein
VAGNLLVECIGTERAIKLEMGGRGEDRWLRMWLREQNAFFNRNVNKHRY